MDDNEKTAALEWALRTDNYAQAIQEEATSAGATATVLSLETGARALLDAVRLLCEGEWDSTDHCPKCFEPPYAYHLPTCEVGSWVRAAARAGL